MNISILQAAPYDFDKLSDIYRREDLLTEKIIQHVEYDFANIGIDRMIWFVTVGDLVVGSVQLLWDLSQKDLANGVSRAYIHHFRIAKDFWGQGLGSKLYKHLEHHAKEKQIQILTLEVERTNTKAQKIYTHYGYSYFRDSLNPLEIALLKNLYPEV